MKIENFDNYNEGLEMAMTFFNSFDSINESKKTSKYKRVQNSELKKLKSAVKGDIHLNFGLIVSFGAGIGALYPIVDSLISLTGPSVDTRTVVLLTMAGVYMIVQGEMKDVEEKKVITSETKVILEELKLAGFPNVATGTKDGSDNSVLNKIVKVLKSIKKIFNSIKGYVERAGLTNMLRRASTNTTSGFADMFAYTAMLAPIMNSINAVIEFSHMDLNSFVANTAIFIAGIAAIIAKHGANFFVSKMKNFFNLGTEEQEEIKNEIEEEIKNKSRNSNFPNSRRPNIKRFSDINNDIEGHEIIQEDSTIDYLLDKIRHYGKESLTKKELQLLDKVSRGEDVSEDEKKLIDKITRRDDTFDYDPRKDDEMVLDFDGWSDEEIDLERLNNLWNDIDDDAIDHFFSYYKIDKNIYLNDKGNLPGEIPSDLVGRFEEFIRNIY